MKDENVEEILHFEHILITVFRDFSIHKELIPRRASPFTLDMKLLLRSNGKVCNDLKKISKCAC